MKLFVATILCLSSISTKAQLSWYKCLSGKIDVYPVTIHLHKQQHKYAGYYYYNSKQQPIYFYGADDSMPGKIRLTAYTPAAETEETFLFSCTGKACGGSWTNAGKTYSFSASEVTLTPSWDYVFTADSAELKPGMENSPTASYDAAAVWPRENSSQSISIKKIINNWYAKESSATDIGKFFLKEKKQFFADYISENKDLADSDIANNYSLNMEQSQAVNVVYQSPALLTLANSVYSYTGGAHGNYGTDYLSIDLVHNKKLDIDDVLSAAGKKQLRSLLEKYFRKEYNLKATDSLTEGGLFENKIEPNDNFLITRKGIGFDYTPYEIGPYAMGEIVIFIPFDELKTYLQHDFNNLLMSK